MIAPPLLHIDGGNEMASPYLARSPRSLSQAKQDLERRRRLQSPADAAEEPGSEHAAIGTGRPALRNKSQDVA